MAKCNLNKESMPVGTRIRLTGKTFRESRIFGEVVVVNTHWFDSGHTLNTYGNIPGFMHDGVQHWCYVNTVHDFSATIVRD